MAYKNPLLKAFNLPEKALSKDGKKQSFDPAITDMMNDPRYLRQSSALVNEALQKGFDVLQLANGDIVTTGTKTVVYHYEWNKQQGKLVKTLTETSDVKPRKQMMDDAGSGLDDEDLETAIAKASSENA